MNLGKGGKKGGGLRLKVVCFYCQKKVASVIKVSLFNQILAYFPKEKFNSLVKKHQSDKYSKEI